MKVSIFIAATCLALAYAHAHHSASSTFTYLTFADLTVKTASTAIPLTKAHGHPLPPARSSYSLNLADIAYPTFSSVTGPLATNAPAPGLPDAITLIGEAAVLIEQFKHANSTNCLTCQKVMAGLAARMKVQQETLSDIATPFCSALQAALPLPICIGLLKVASTDIGGIFPAV
jgi:hypothetical protein